MRVDNVPGLARRRSQSRTKGFTLIELMISLVVVSILLMVALPSYQQHTRKTYRALGKAGLLEALARQEQFFVNNRRYAADLTDLGYPADPYSLDANGNRVAVTATDRIYTIQFSGDPTATAYTLEAVPQLTQVKDTLCATLRLTSAKVKSVTGSASTGDCW